MSVNNQLRKYPITNDESISKKIIKDTVISNKKINRDTIDLSVELKEKIDSILLEIEALKKNQKNIIDVLNKLSIDFDNTKNKIVR